MMPGLKRSVSATTRPRRRGERDGRDYFFYDKKEFQEKKAKGFFLEWAKVFDCYYGTPEKHVRQTVAKGCDVLLTIDVQGARKIRKKIKDAVTVFLVPPSMRVLRERLIQRETDSSQEIEKRLRTAEEEMEAVRCYDYVVVNDIVKDAAAAVRNIIEAEKHKVTRNEEVLHGLYRS